MAKLFQECVPLQTAGGGWYDGCDFKKTRTTFLCIENTLHIQELFSHAPFYQQSNLAQFRNSFPMWWVVSLERILDELIVVCYYADIVKHQPFHDQRQSFTKVVSFSFPPKHSFSHDWGGISNAEIILYEHV